MVVTGYSLSPGGLLFPYHIGVLTALEHLGALEDASPIAGSSAGAIAVCSHGARVKPEVALDATIRMAETCDTMGGARGNLLPLLQHELETILPEDSHLTINNREGLVGMAYYEIFPKRRPVLATNFDSKDDLINAVCNSSAFPFFSSNWPCRISKSSSSSKSLLPRLAMDGYFTVPRDRFGCPDFGQLLVNNNDDPDSAPQQPQKSIPQRTVTVSVFPHDSINLTASEKQDRISPLPSEDTAQQFGELIQWATQTTNKQDYHKMYENGWEDAERWFHNENSRL